MTAHQEIAALHSTGSPKRSTPHGSSHKLPEVEEKLDTVIDKEAERLGVEATQVGQVLSAISDDLRDTAKGLGGAENQAEQYFFDKIINVAKAVGKGVQGLATVVGDTVNDAKKKRSSPSRGPRERPPPRLHT
ncbi:hypothetical protein MTO96_041153 [Rhipicephalus appendiculatus]